MEHTHVWRRGYSQTHPLITGEGTFISGGLSHIDIRGAADNISYLPSINSKCVLMVAREETPEFDSEVRPSREE